MLLLYSKTMPTEHLKSQKFHHCPVMTKQLAHNVIAEFWSKTFRKLWYKGKKQQKVFAYNFFSEQNRANIPFRADTNVTLLILLI